MLYVNGNRRQTLMQGDLQTDGTVDRFIDALPDEVPLVYSDPPWNPGNASYWRTHAGLGACKSYDDLMDKWCSIVCECQRRGTKDVFIEQSKIDKHKNMFLEAVERCGDKWKLPLIEEWKVFYGSPGSASVRNLNVLLHFGTDYLKTDPTGMDGEPMTIRVCSGLHLSSGATVVDPCIGKGMTSRMAHYFEWDCVGNELNPKRLEKTVQWITKRGYELVN